MEVIVKFGTTEIAFLLLDASSQLPAAAPACKFFSFKNLSKKNSRKRFIFFKTDHKNN